MQPSPSQHLRSLLLKHLAQKRLKNRAYSLRNFSRLLGISPAQLSQLISGKRNLSARVGAKIAARLSLSPVETSILLASVRRRKDGRPLHEFTPASFPQRVLDQEAFEVVGKWYCYAILCLAEENFTAHAPAIAKRLGISLSTAKCALKSLQRFDMLRVSPEGTLSCTTASLTTTEDIASTALKHFHRDILEKAQDALVHQPVDVRDFSTVVMSIDPKNISTAKNLIRNFRRKLSQLLEDGEKNQIYTLSIQLFSLEEKANV